MNENSSFTALIQRVRGGCERMKGRRANGLMRAAGKRKRVMADGIRVRYQSVACIYARKMSGVFTQTGWYRRDLSLSQ